MTREYWLEKRVKALEELCVCYRLDKRPSEKLFDALEKSKKKLEE